MESLFNNNPSTSLDHNFNPIILDIRGIQDSSDELTDRKVDISTASIEELSSLVVSDMIKSVRKDLSSIKVSSAK